MQWLTALRWVSEWRRNIVLCGIGAISAMQI
jgi:hypothetical protein